jgi:hypothetical protein
MVSKKGSFFFKPQPEVYFSPQKAGVHKQQMQRDAAQG